MMEEIADTGTVFVVDDDASVRKALSRLLRATGFTVEVFASATEFLERPVFEEVGCILLDIRMPGPSGLDLQNRLADENRPLPIVFITGHGDIPTSVKAMKKGAVDFLTKPIDEGELLAAVQIALDKSRAVQKTRMALKEAADRLRALSPREREVAVLVIRGLLNKQIAGKLGISVPTVKIHRGRIMRKLSVGSMPELICALGGLEPQEIHEASIQAM
jgi:FixJ family two-component response regulator